MANVVAALAHRKLRARRFIGEPTIGAIGWRDARDEPELSREFATPGEELIGIYENGAGVDPALILVTDLALRFPGSTEPAIAFSAIARTTPPKSKTKGPREIAIELHEGVVRQLPVVGRHGERDQFQDVYAFNMFLRGIVDRLARERRRDTNTG